MGLGKTLQTIAFLHTYHHHFPDHHSLLVLPKNVMYNWMTEFEMWLGKTKPSALTIDKASCRSNLRITSEAEPRLSVQTNMLFLVCVACLFSRCTNVKLQMIAQRA